VIVRLVIGVVLTATLVAVATPAMSTVRVDAADSTVERQLTALGDRLQRLVATNYPTEGPGARHVTTLRLPERSVTSARVESIRLENRAGVGTATWRVAGGPPERHRLVGVPFRARDGNLTLKDTGPHRLAFRFRSRSTGPVLTVRRLGGGSE